MEFIRQSLKPIIVMTVLFALVFVIKSPIKTWLSPPDNIAQAYYMTINDDQFVEYGLVTNVSDGDTITINDQIEVRLLAIDTPELAHPELYIKEECFGKDAKARLQQLILNKYVFLLKDKEDKDKYNRSLRYIFMPDLNNPNNKVFINAYLVGEGFARAFIMSADEKYKDKIFSLQETAISKKKGLWGSCDRNKFRW